MDIIKNYVKKFMSEGEVKKDPLSAEMDKIRDLIDLDEGSEFEITVGFCGETNRSVDPETGAYHSTEVDDSASGHLDILKDGENSWEWYAFIPNDYDFDLGGRVGGFDSLEECLDSVREWAEEFTDFTVDGLA